MASSDLESLEYEPGNLKVIEAVDSGNEGDEDEDDDIPKLEPADQSYR